MSLGVRETRNGSDTQIGRKGKKPRGRMEININRLIYIIRASWTKLGEGQAFLISNKLLCHYLGVGWWVRERLVTITSSLREIKLWTYSLE